MDTDVTDPYEPAEFYQPVELPEPTDQTEVAAPVLPWWRRKAVLAGSALVAALALIGALVLAFSGTSPKQQAAIKPHIEPSYEAPVPSTPSAEPESLSGGLLGADAATSTSFGSSSSTPMGGLSAPASGFELPAAPAFPSAPPMDWAALINPYLEAQANAQSANIASSVAGWSVGAAVGLTNSAALVLGDLILFAAYTNNGPAILSQLAASLPATPAAAAALQTAVANLPPLPPPPDFTGLAAAFAAAPALPSLALPGVPQLPGLPAVGLPPLPTPEQMLALASLPAIGLPALPPPPIGLPPIGLPQLPPPPDLSFLFFLPPIGLPSIGLPSIGLPSITRLLGLPF